MDTSFSVTARFVADTSRYLGGVTRIRQANQGVEESLRRNADATRKMVAALEEATKAQQRAAAASRAEAEALRRERAALDDIARSRRQSKAHADAENRSLKERLSLLGKIAAATGGTAVAGAAAMRYTQRGAAGGRKIDTAALSRDAGRAGNVAAAAFGAAFGPGFLGKIAGGALSAASLGPVSTIGARYAEGLAGSMENTLRTRSTNPVNRFLNDMAGTPVVRVVGGLLGATLVSAMSKKIREGVSQLSGDFAPIVAMAKSFGPEILALGANKLGAGGALNFLTGAAGGVTGVAGQQLGQLGVSLAKHVKNVGEAILSHSKLAVSLGLVAPPAEKAGNALERMMNPLKVVGAAMVFKGLDALIGKLRGEFQKTVIEAGARVETLDLTLQQFGKTSGYVPGALRGQVEELKKAGIETKEAQGAVADALKSGISMAQLKPLADVSKNAAVVSGRNTSETFSNLIYGAVSGQTDVVRTQGLNVSFEDAYSKEAAQRKVSVKALTEEQRMRARVNAIIESGTRIVGAYDAAMETAGKQLTSTKRYVEEIRNSIGTALNPILYVVVKQTNDWIKAMGDLVKEGSPFWNKLRTWSVDAGKAIHDFAGQIEDAFERVNWDAWAAKAKSAFEQVKKAKTLVAAAGGAGGAFAASRLGGLAGIASPLGPMQGAIIGAVASSKELRQAFVSVFKDIAAAAANVAAAMMPAVQAVDDFIQRNASGFAEIITTVGETIRTFSYLAPALMQIAAIAAGPLAMAFMGPLSLALGNVVNIMGAIAGNRAAVTTILALVAAFKFTGPIRQMLMLNMMLMGLQRAIGMLKISQSIPGFEAFGDVLAKNATRSLKLGVALGAIGAGLTVLATLWGLQMERMAKVRQGVQDYYAAFKENHGAIAALDQIDDKISDVQAHVTSVSNQKKIPILGLFVDMQGNNNEEKANLEGLRAARTDIVKGVTDDARTQGKAMADSLKKTKTDLKNTVEVIGVLLGQEAKSWLENTDMTTAQAKKLGDSVQGVLDQTRGWAENATSVSEALMQKEVVGFASLQAYYEQKARDIKSFWANISILQQAGAPDAMIQDLVASGPEKVGVPLSRMVADAFATGGLDGVKRAVAGVKGAFDQVSNEASLGATNTAKRMVFGNQELKLDTAEQVTDVVKQRQDIQDQVDEAKQSLADLGRSMSAQATSGDLTKGITVGKDLFVRGVNEWKSALGDYQRVLGDVTSTETQRQTAQQRYVNAQNTLRGQLKDNAVGDVFKGQLDEADNLLKQNREAQTQINAYNQMLAAAAASKNPEVALNAVKAGFGPQVVAAAAQAGTEAGNAMGTNTANAAASASGQAANAGAIVGSAYKNAAVAAAAGALLPGGARGLGGKLPPGLAGGKGGGTAAVAAPAVSTATSEQIAVADLVQGQLSARNKQVADLQTALNKQLADIDRQGAEQRADAAQNYGKQQANAAKQLNRQLEDAARNHQKALSDFAADLANPRKTKPADLVGEGAAYAARGLSTDAARGGTATSAIDAMKALRAVPAGSPIAKQQAELATQIQNVVQALAQEAAAAAEAGRIGNTTGAQTDYMRQRFDELTGTTGDLTQAMRNLERQYQSIDDVIEQVNTDLDKSLNRQISIVEGMNRAADSALAMRKQMDINRAILTSNLLSDEQRQEIHRESVSLLNDYVRAVQEQAAAEARAGRIGQDTASIEAYIAQKLAETAAMYPELAGELNQYTTALGKVQAENATASGSIGGLINGVRDQLGQIPTAIQSVINIKIADNAAEATASYNDQVAEIHRSYQQGLEDMASDYGDTLSGLGESTGKARADAQRVFAENLAEIEKQYSAHLDEMAKMTAAANENAAVEAMAKWMSPTKAAIDALGPLTFDVGAKRPSAGPQYNTGGSSGAVADANKRTSRTLSDLEASYHDASEATYLYSNDSQRAAEIVTRTSGNLESLTNSVIDQAWAMVDSGKIANDWGSINQWVNGQIRDLTRDMPELSGEVDAYTGTVKNVPPEWTTDLMANSAEGRAAIDYYLRTSVTQAKAPVSTTVGAYAGPGVNEMKNWDGWKRWGANPITTTVYADTRPARDAVMRLQEDIYRYLGAYAPGGEIGHVYDQGGWLGQGVSVLLNKTGQKEAILNPAQMKGLGTLLDQAGVDTAGGLHKALEGVAAKGGAGPMVFDQGGFIGGPANGQHLVTGGGAAIGSTDTGRLIVVSGGGQSKGVVVHGDLVVKSDQRPKAWMQEGAWGAVHGMSETR